MGIAVVPPKSSKIRAFAQANPTLDERALARRLGLMASEIRHALGTSPKGRIRSGAR